MTNTHLEIEVLEHVSDEFVAYLTEETLETADETIERVLFWICSATANGISSYLEECLDEGLKNEELRISRELFTAGLTINVSHSHSGEMLVQIQVPFDYESRLLSKEQVFVKPWSTSEIAIYIADQLKHQHFKSGE